MSGHKKKIVVLLVAAALGSGLLLAASRLGEGRGRPGSSCVMRDAYGDKSSETDAIRNTQYARRKTQYEAGSLFANDPNFSTKTTGNSATQELFLKTMLAVLLVVVLGVAAIYASRKLLPRITNLPGKQIRILETVHLGPRKAVHLIEIEDRSQKTEDTKNSKFPATGRVRLLIGSTNESITTLADMTAALEESCLPTGKISAQEVENNMRI